MADATTYGTARAAARAWAAERGIAGRPGGNAYLYTDGSLWRPWWTGHRAVQGYNHLAAVLEEQGVLLYDEARAVYYLAGGA
jgi:hypothetical protein